MDAPPGGATHAYSDAEYERLRARSNTGRGLAITGFVFDGLGFHLGMGGLSGVALHVFDLPFTMVRGSGHVRTEVSMVRVDGRSGGNHGGGGR